MTKSPHLQVARPVQGQSQMAQHGQRVAFEVPQSAVAQPSTDSAPVTGELQELWRADAFELGKIPESAPPPEVC